jgi:glycerol-3-phosphate dehydrogenase (NAD(P)+)
MNGYGIVVVGAGAFGTALAKILANKYKNLAIHLWCRRKKVADDIQKYHENKERLPQIKLPLNIIPTTSLQIISEKYILILAIPCAFLRSVIQKIKKYIQKDSLIISIVKGIENNSLLRPSEIVKEELGNLQYDYACISGPSFAYEVAQECPTAVSVSSWNPKIAVYVRDFFHTDYFRVYDNDDVIGTEVGGALKNVIAIAAGISDGLRLGYNARASLITRGLEEIKRLGVKMGAKKETFSGLAGIGDLIATCTSDLSRNRRVGLKIANKGKNLKSILQEIEGVSEGVNTALSACQLAEKYKTEMPITKEVYAILFKNKDPQVALKALTKREPRFEF